MAADRSGRSGASSRGSADGDSGVQGALALDGEVPAADPGSSGERRQSAGSRGRTGSGNASGQQEAEAAGESPSVTGGHEGSAAVPTSGDNSVDAVDNSAASVERTTGSDGAELRGADLAKAALQAAKEQSAGRRKKSGPKRVVTGQRRRRGWSGSRADDRDPQPLGRLASRIARDHGWTDRLAGGQVFAKWPHLVGEDVAEHTKPVALKDGELTVQAQSTAWATQLRLLQRQILKRISDGVGRDVVRRIKVQGPAAPSWRHGPRHVSGRGPRDTYG